jgi:hypothetical protein
MREWIEELSDYMQNQEKVSSSLTELSEEVHQAALETDFLLQASDQVQSAYASLIGKMDHVGS